MCRLKLKSRQRRSRFQSQSIQLPARISWILAEPKMPSVSNSDSLLSDFYSGQLMKFGVRTRVERCESSGLLTELAGAIPGTRLQKNGCSGHQMRSPPIDLTSVSLVDGVMTLLNVVTRLSKSPHARPRPQRESSNVWRLRAECASKTERWNANIRLTVSASKLIWSSERGTTTYVRCPMASASR